jgi:hypothetical protein
VENRKEVANIDFKFAPCQKQMPQTALNINFLMNIEIAALLLGAVSVVYIIFKMRNKK